MTDSVIQLNSISKTYVSALKPRRVLNALNFHANGGERIALVGPNGSGKTTLLRILLGIVHPDSGNVTFRISAGQENMSYVPQDYRNALFPWLRLRQNLELATRGLSPAGGHEQQSRHQIGLTGFVDLTSTFRIHLNLDKYPYELSGGEQQIFSLIRALLSDPGVIVLDEPLSAVDFGRKRVILGYLLDWLAHTPVTLIIASHDFEEAVLLADRVCILGADSGQIVDLTVDLPWPRSLSLRDDPRFRSYVDQLIQITK